MCSQCRSNYSSNGYDACWSSPDLPKQCPKPYEAHCVTMDSQLKNAKSQDWYKRFIQRGCSYYNVGITCSDVMYGDIEVRNCNRTCHVSGCNLGKFESYNTYLIPFYSFWQFLEIVKPDLIRLIEPAELIEAGIV